MSTPRRVLVVAYNFPPIGGIGVQRTRKFATYLPDSGWEPVVLTARNPGVRPLDEAALRTLPPGLRVERAFSPEPVKVRRRLGDVARAMRRAALSRPGANASATAATTPDSAPAAAAAPSARRSWGPFGSWWAAYVRLAFFPDEQIGWVPFAVRRGLELHREAPFDAVYSSAGPFSSHLAAALIARKTGRPWVADFRDPWVGNAFARRLPLWQASLQRRLERAMIARAAAVVFVTDGIREQYASRYPGAAGKMTAIPNGYDRNDFGADVLAAIDERAAARARGGEAPTPGATEPHALYRFVYAGSVYGERELRLFLEGVELLLARRPELRGRFEVEFVGWLNERNQAIAREYDAPERLGAVVRYEPFVPHAEALRRMLAADALLTIIADEPGKNIVLGGKLPEYAGLDRQIVAFAPEGAARAFLRELDWGIVEDPTAEGVAAGLAGAMEMPLPPRAADPDGRYDRVNLTRRLASVLDDVTADGSRGGRAADASPR